MSLFLSALGKIVLELGHDYARHKMADRKSYQKARSMRLAEAAKSQSDWQALMAEASAHSWKDEAWTLCFILILLMCFVPPLQDAVRQGFALLSETPDWFQWACLASIAASFGIRGVSYFSKQGRQDA